MLKKQFKKINTIKTSWRNSFQFCLLPSGSRESSPSQPVSFQSPAASLTAHVCRDKGSPHCSFQAGGCVYRPLHASVRGRLGSRGWSTQDEDFKADSDPMRQRPYCPQDPQVSWLLGTLSLFSWGSLWHWLGSKLIDMHTWRENQVSCARAGEPGTTAPFHSAGEGSGFARRLEDAVFFSWS